MGSHIDRPRMPWRKRLYLSPLAPVISMALHVIGRMSRPIMVYGFKNRVQGQFHKFTRISSSTVLMNKGNLDIGDHTWIGHYSIIDGTDRVTIGRGCQLAAWVAVYTHSSHDALRLLGTQYLESEGASLAGYVTGPVTIGEFTFLGAKTSVLPGVTIGRGCIIAAHSLVNRDVPDFAVMCGSPARIVGDTRERDAAHLKNVDVKGTYYAPELLPELTDKLP